MKPRNAPERRGALVPATVAARVLGADARTVRRWIRLDVLRGTRVAAYADGRGRWYVHRDALDAWTARQPPSSAPAPITGRGSNWIHPARPRA